MSKLPFHRAFTQDESFLKTQKHKFIPPSTRTDITSMTTAADFLRDYSFKVDLSQLINIEDVCCYHENNSYFMILVGLSDDLIEYYGSKYQLQIIRKKDSAIVFKKEIHDKPKAWNIFKEAAVFWIVNDSKQSQIFVIEIQRNFAVTILEDIEYDQNLMCTGSGKEEEKGGKDQKMRMQPRKQGHRGQASKVCTLLYTMDLSDIGQLHSFFENFNLDGQSFQMMCLIEGKNGLMAAYTIIQVKGNIFELEQVRQNFERDDEFDPITKFKFYIDDQNMFFGISLRQSGHSDIYYNYCMCSSSKNLQKVDLADGIKRIGLKLQARVHSEIKDNTVINHPTYSDFKITRQAIYAKKREYINSPINPLVIEERFTQVEFKLSYRQRIGFQTSHEEWFDQQTWDSMSFSLFNENLKLFTSMTVIGTYLAVSHSNIVSIYDFKKIATENQQDQGMTDDEYWIQHIQFKEHSKIRQIIKSKSKDSVYPTLVICFDDNMMIYLKRNEQLQAANRSQMDIGKNKQNDWIENGFTKANMYFEQTMTPWRGSGIHYFLSKDVVKCSSSIDVLYKQDLYSLTARGLSVNTDEQMIKVISMDGGEDLLVYSFERKSLRQYSLRFVVGPPSNDMSKSLYKKPILTLLLDIELAIQEEQVFQSAIISTENKKIVLLGSQGTYIINSKNGIFVKRQSLTLSSSIMIDQMYLYSIKNFCLKQNSGVYIQSIQSLYYEDGKPKGAFKIERATGGLSNYLEYIPSDERIAYQPDFKTINIIPVVHRNVISFFGMKERKHYLAFRETNEYLTALGKDLVLTQWSKLNGRVARSFKIQNDDIIGQLTKLELKNCEVYQEDMSDFYYRAKFNNFTSLLVSNENRQLSLNKFDISSHIGSRMQQSLNKSVFKRFKLIEITADNKIFCKLSFHHQIPALKEFRPMLYISCDDNLQYMLEKTIDSIVLHKKSEYKSDNYKPSRPSEDSLAEVYDIEYQWNQYRRISDFSVDTQMLTSIRYLFSPDMSKYMDYDLRSDIFQIMSSDTGQLIQPFPRGLLNPSTEDPNLILKMFIWLNNEEFKIINSYGFEKRILVTKKKLQQVGYCKIPMIDTNHIKSNICHFYTNIEFSDITNTFERLLWRYTQYFSAIYTEEATVQQRISLFCKVDYGILEKAQADNADQSFLVEYQSKNEPVMQFSFTYLNWKIAEQLKILQDIRYLKHISVENIKALTLSIFPTGETIIHKLFDKPTYIKELYNNINTANSQEKEPMNIFNIPFLRDLEGNSPVHNCLNCQNYQALDVFLQVLRKDGIDNHIRSFIEKFPHLITQSLPSLDEYITSRSFKTDMLAHFKKGTLNLQELEDRAIDVAPLWPDKNEIKNELLVQSMKDLVDIEIKVFDIPLIHNYISKEGEEFTQALADVKNLDIFKSFFIQCLVDYKWPLVRKYIVLTLFLPAIFQLLMFVIYSNFLTGQFNDSYSYFWTKIAFIIGLCVTSQYFLYNEFRQMKSLKWDYFEQFWNYADLFPPILIPVICAFHLNEIINPDEYEIPDWLVSVHAVCSFLLWVKFLYFLRIFRITGYLINMLSNVLWDMKVFLFILTIVIIAFGEAFLRLSHTTTNIKDLTDEDEPLLPNYAAALFFAFGLTLGESSGDHYPDTIQPITNYIFSVLASLYINIVMLNLLIAIISKSFDRITADEESANYQERAQMISENYYLIWKRARCEHSQPQSYITYAKRVMSKEEERNQQDPKELNYEMIQQIIDNQQHFIEKIDQIPEINRRIDNIQKNTEEMLAQISQKIRLDDIKVDKSEFD